MSFLDNLESNLKSLESQEEAADSVQREARARAGQRATAQAAAPFAEELRKGRFTDELLKHAVRLGHRQRVKVHIAWLGSTLRLEARERRLELRPTPQGVIAAYLENNQETRSFPVDLKDDPERLAREWLEAA